MKQFLFILCCFTTVLLAQQPISPAFNNTQTYSSFSERDITFNVTQNLTLTKKENKANQKKTEGVIPSENNKQKDLTKQQLFKKAFGQSIPQKTYAIEIQIKVENQTFVPITIESNPYTNQLYFNTMSFWTVIKKQAESSLLESLKDLQDDKQRLSKTTLIQLGFYFDYNDKKLLLYTELPYNYKKVKKISVNGDKSGVLSMNLYKNKTINGYLNASSQFQDSSQQVHIKSMLNVYQLPSLETQMNYKGAGYDFELWRLYYDLLPLNSLVSVGKVAIPEMFSFTDLNGASIEKSYEYYGKNYPKRDVYKNITIHKLSKVTITNNGRFLFEKTFKPGNYILHDFSLETGKNELVIRIYDLKSNTETIHSETIYYNTEVLDKGALEYSVVVGEDQLKKSKAFGLGLNFGLGTSLVVQPTYEYQSENHKLGIRLYQARPSGIWDMKTSFNPTWINEKQTQLNLNLRNYPFRYKTTNIQHNYSLKLDSHKNLNMNNNSYKWVSIGTDTNLAFKKNIGIQFSTGWQTFYRLNWNSFDFTSSVYYKFRTFKTQLKWSTKRPIGAKRTSQMVFQVRKVFGKNEVYSETTIVPENTTFLTRYQQTKEGDYTTQWGLEKHDLSSDERHFRVYRANQFYNTNYTLKQNTKGVDQHFLNMQYEGRRGTIRSRSSQFNQSLNHTLYLDTSIVFINQHVALSRPIQDNFIMFKAPRKLNAKSITLSTNDKVSLFGPAVVTKERGYYKSHISILKEDLGDNRFLQKRSYKLFPRTRYGQFVSFADEGLIMLYGSLIDDLNAPITYSMGTLKDSQGQSKKIFTNKKGQFVITGIKPGTYTLELFDTRYNQIKIVVPNQDQTMFKHPPIKVNMKETL